MSFFYHITTLKLILRIFKKHWVEMKISDRERIPMIVTKMSIEDIKDALNRI